MMKGETFRENFSRSIVRFNLMKKDRLVTAAFMEEIEILREEIEKTGKRFPRAHVARQAFGDTGDQVRKYRSLCNGSQILTLEDAYKLAHVFNDSMDHVLYRALSKLGSKFNVSAKG